MSRVENRTNEHTQVQHCCTNLAKWLQHHAISTNVGWKIWPVSNLSQQHPTCCNKSQQGGQIHATYCTQQCWNKLHWNVAIIWLGLYAISISNIDYVTCEPIASPSFHSIFSGSLGKATGAVASCLVCLTPEQAVLVRALAGDIVLCSWARHFTLTVSLCTQASVVQKLDNAIHWINCYPADKC